MSRLEVIQGMRNFAEQGQRNVNPNASRSHTIRSDSIWYGMPIEEKLRKDKTTWSKTERK